MVDKLKGDAIDASGNLVVASVTAGNTQLHTTGITISNVSINTTSIAVGNSSSNIALVHDTIRGPATMYIDPSAVGDNTGLLIVKGDLQVDGTTTTINSTTVTVDDKNIILASGAVNNAAADGAGITIDTVNANITYNSTSNTFDITRGLKVTGAANVSSTLGVAGALSAGNTTVTGTLQANNTNITGTANVSSTLGVSGTSTLDGKTEVKQFQISRNANNAAIWFGEINLDDNHVLWNDYYGGPTTKGASGSGFDGLKWNTYKGIQIRTGSAGQYNSLIVSGSGASTNDHQVYLYGANDEKLRTVTDDGITIQRDLYITGSTGGNYANRLIIGGTTTPYTAQDTNLRPTLYMTGAYPVITLNTNTTQNASHGGTLQFTANGAGSQFVIGTNGTGTMLSMGYGSASDWNPHNGIGGYQGVSYFQAGTDGYIGLGRWGDWGVSGGYGDNVPAYNLHYIGKINGTNGHAGLFRNMSSGAGGDGNGSGFCFFQDRGDHSWGIVSEFRIGNSAGSDRPSILFSNAYDTKTWTCGYGYNDSDYYRINIDHGHRNSSWGTTKFTLDRSGNLTIAGTLTQNSDERIKHNIRPIENALGKVKRLNGVTYNYNDDNRPGLGLIAQNVEAVQPELVSEVANPVDGELKTYKSVSYGNLVGLLVEAIKEQQGIIDQLKADVESLKTKVA